jgi:uncharacterized protein (DUF1501 family)/uncharacterized protein (DUF1800 family)
LQISTRANGGNSGIGNPAVFFDDQTPPTNPTVNLNGKTIVVDSQYYPLRQNDQELFLESDLDDDVCNSAPSVTGFPAYEVVGIFQGEYYIHDPRWSIYDNTVETPKPDGGGAIQRQVDAVVQRPAFFRTQCGNVEMNFINEESCYLNTARGVCSVNEETDKGSLVQSRVELSQSNFGLYYRFTNGARLIYTVTGLRQDEPGLPYDPPCTPSTKSRWIPKNNANQCSQGSPGTTTSSTFARLLGASDDTNPSVRDIFTPAFGDICDNVDLEKFDLQVLMGDECWQNVHQDHLQVFDFTPWVDEHPGGRTPILRFTESNFMLEFPDWHAMSRWHEDGRDFRTSVGRLGDTVQLSLPAAAVDFIGAEVVGGDSSQRTPSGVVCGSPDEVGNDETEYGSIERGAFDAATNRNRTTPDVILSHQRLNIWMDSALNVPDQLRQKIAWALAQLLVITPSDVEVTKSDLTETFLVYYDTFVRHAFGNYRDILREVTFSPLMGEMLSYVDSRSTAYIWQTERKIEYADENFAREVMQLFSVGLYKMYNNGTRVIDSSGQKVRTYTNDEISEYARLYTGFQRRTRRGNMEDALPQANLNPIDPMKINIGFRDTLPKLGLNNLYVGDSRPLCRDLPHQHFLKKGARYRLLGLNPTPKMLREPDSWLSNDSVLRLRLDQTSALYQKICNQEGTNGSCVFKGVIELDEDLSCSDSLCDIEAPRVVEVESGVYFEYIRQACSRFAFYSNGKAMQKYGQQFYCEDPALQEGAVSCCANGNGQAQTFGLFSGERVSFAKAQTRCDSNDQNFCLNLPSDCSRTNSCDDSVGYWTSESCSLQVKIDLEGRVALVHSPPSQIGKANVDPHVREDTKSFFRVDWNQPIVDLLQDYEIECSQLGCVRGSSDNLCICPTTVIESQAFSRNPSREEVLRLKVGVFLDELEGTVKKNLSDGVTLHSESGSLSERSIFEVVDDNGMTIMRKNIRSDVIVGSNDSLGYSFRNPPHLLSVTHPELRDAYYETEEGLDHYFYHPNMAPFLAIRFAKRFGNSNPSPRYVDVMATAFRSGFYEDNEKGKKFGTGRYGDLSALVAAMLLDREARSEVLDVDPAFGSILEPFLRLLRLFRSLEFVPNVDHPMIELAPSLVDVIGQEPYMLPSVFSFFFPEYQPRGPVGEASLSCPECQQLTVPKTVALLNGMFSLLKYGLDYAYGGFGLKPRDGNDLVVDRVLGQTALASGSTQYNPGESASPSVVVDELSTLLTSGRLGTRKRELLEGAYVEFLSTGTQRQALINLQQLIITTPEFHSNTISDNSEGDRLEPGGKQPSDKPYKAVIFLMLEGGFDSFNMLVPHNCPDSDLVEQYNQERGEVAFTDDERNLQIDASLSDQPCSAFAIHQALPIVKELYDDGDLAFFANTGVFGSAEMTKTNYFQVTPIQLFAHNTMQHETKAMDVFEESSGTGVLGRLSKVLTDRGFKTGSISVDNPSIAVASALGTAPEPLILSRFGAQELGPRPDSETLDIKKYSAALNAKSGNYSSIFGETWSEGLTSAIVQAQKFKDLLGNVDLGAHWPIATEDAPVPEFVQKLKLLSKLIETRELRGVDRDFLYTSFGGWDHHSLLKQNLQDKFQSLNEAIDVFVTEMKRQGTFDDVTVVVTSDFGRTITPNSGGGTDHAWAGNYFAFGGSLKGGRVHGRYPDNITADSPLNLGRGRIMPTTSWDSIWNSVSEWMGAETEEELDYCLPNRKATAGSAEDIFTGIFKKDDLFSTEAEGSRRHLRSG